METEVTISGLISSSLEGRWNKYIQELNRCRLEFSEEAVHDVRVATRRLLALIDLFTFLYPYVQTRKTLLALKDQLDSYDDLRDTQVMLLEVNQRVQEIPVLTPFQKFLVKREKNLLQVAEKNIKTYKLNNLEKRISALQKTVQKAEENPTIYNNLFQTLDDVYASVLKRFKRIDPNIPPTIHRVRVRFKKFRYMVECVHPLIPNFPDSNLQKMHDYQTLMGNIQDVEVLLSTLNTFAGKKNGRKLSQPIEYYQVKHTNTIQTYMETKDELYQFWRLSSAKPFPWEESASPAPTTKKPKHSSKQTEKESEETSQLTVDA